jgi:hypothetical protein
LKTGVLLDHDPLVTPMLPRSLTRPRRGRPLKFGRPAQPVTLTLPDDVVAALRHLDGDLGRAIVRLAQPPVSAVLPHAPVELSYWGRSAIIVIRRCRTLQDTPGVELIPLPDGRFLISLDPSVGPAGLEGILRNALQVKGIPKDDRDILDALATVLRSARQMSGIDVRERSILVLESQRGQAQGRPRGVRTRAKAAR